MPDFAWSKEWCIRTRDRSLKVGQTILVTSKSNGTKRVKVDAIVPRLTRKGDEYFLLFTTDVE